MKKAIYVLILFLYSINASAKPLVQTHYFWMSFLSTPPTTIFYGETLRIPVVMDWRANVATGNRHLSVMSMPEGSYVEYIPGNCLNLMSYVSFWQSYQCYMNIVIVGNNPTKAVSGVLNYNSCTICDRTSHIQYDFQSPFFSVRVLPHPLSMLPIPTQDATANELFVYNLKTAVKYYDENSWSGKPAQGIVTPASQDGLYFDASSFSIQGKPTRMGSYIFTVGAQNEFGRAEAVTLNIEVHANPKDRPVFKTQYSIASALPSQQYRLNLMELIEPLPGFMITNQVSFHKRSNVNNPEWLDIAKDNATLLIGEVPSDLAGKNVEIELVASSNTGGISDSMVIKIPIAYDPARKPSVEPFALQFQADTQINQDLAGHVDAQGDDATLKIILDTVEPQARWLSISSINQTHLEGTIPSDAIGQLYQLTFRANTASGGSSAPITIPLQIEINKMFTPRFKAANPNLALAQVNQPYFYDFKANKDVYPEFEDAAYEISFANEFERPQWLTLKNNQLRAENVPGNIEFPVVIDVTIKNIPGGISHPISLLLSGNN